MSYRNVMELRFLARSENEAFARITVASFVAQLDPTVEEITDLKTVVSEAVTNAIIHGYESVENGMIYLKAELEDNKVTLIIEDKGQGIGNIEEARRPLFTTKEDLERSGMGFTIMENFMDSIEVFSERGKGTKLVLTKILTANEALCN